MNNDTAEFATRLRTCRGQTGMTRAALARKVDCDYATATNWERGDSYPHPHNLVALAEALGCPVSDLDPRGVLDHRPSWKRHDDPTVQQLRAFGQRIKEAREASGFSRRELAKKVGCDASAVTHWERGKVFPSRRHLFALAASLSCKPDDLDPRDSECKPPVEAPAYVRLVRKLRSLRASQWVVVEKLADALLCERSAS